MSKKTKKVLIVHSSGPSVIKFGEPWPPTTLTDIKSEIVEIEETEPSPINDQTK